MKKFLSIFFPLIIFMSFVLPVYAQEKLEGNPCLYDSPLTKDPVVTMKCVAPLFANIIYWLFIFSGTVAVFLIIIGGIKFLTSGGAQDKVEGAKKTIIWAVIGLVVILFSFMTVNIIADLTKVNCITQFGFSQCGGDGDFKPCSNLNPTGYCPKEGQACVWDTGGDYFHCQWPCGKGDNPKAGFCTQNKKCTTLETPYHVTYYQCR